ncbi:hypothetical protein NC652_030017 [Populus alba x Populus x berolinensis]|nr:hypothetical protein NC652_030017 [Populus alba x Populus x berolinensis]
MGFKNDYKLDDVAREEFAGVTIYARLILIGRCCLEFGRDNCNYIYTAFGSGFTENQQQTIYLSGNSTVRCISDMISLHFTGIN